MFSADVLKNVADFMQWFSLNTEHPDSNKTDGCVRMLAYCQNGDVTPIGYVARRSDGLFWNFTNNPSVHCRGYTGVYFDDADECATELFTHILPDIVRLVYNTSDFGYFPMIDFKKRDALAFREYAPEKLSEAFKCGMDWAIRSEGVFARRPSWAKFEVQNRDGSISWFEDEPVADHNTGKWSCKTGRSKNHLLHEKWSSSLLKVA